MAENPTINWVGESGKQYKFYIKRLPVSFNENQDGNYIYARLNEDNRWIPIYIGQGDLKARTENHHQSGCINLKGATHIHVHLNSLKEDRLVEERDLLAHYTNAYQPNGCNEREGG